MAMDFTTRHNNYNDMFNLTMLSVTSNISDEDIARLQRIRREWNFYDGFHWEEIPEEDKPEVTENYCRTYVNKFIAFEFGKGFSVKPHEKVEKSTLNKDGDTQLDFLTEIWRDNDQNLFCTEMGQMKSITGDAWVQVKFYPPENLEDPYGEYPKGRIRVLVSPSSVVFPMYDVHDKEKLVQVTIQYPIEVREKSPFLRRTSLKKEVYKQVWTSERVEVWEGNKQTLDIVNKYGVIPFTQVKNMPVAGRTEGLGDLEDLIPLNMELNMKKSDISEIIDYHSAPITIVYGAKIGSLEKGANKIWGGLPKEAKVENLGLEGDLVASVSYVKDLKITMGEIAGVPEGALGGTQSISNTSGVALQFSNLPLTEKTRLKKRSSKTGLEKINKMILLFAVKEGLIAIPSGVSTKEFYHVEVTIPDNLPKDLLLELQSIEQEMKLGLEDRKGAMSRLSKEDIEKRLKEIDIDRKAYPDIYIKDSVKTNSGFTNGQTSVEQTRKETQGKNG